MEYIFFFFLIFVNVQSKQKERQQLTPDSDRSNSRKVIDSWRNDANIIKFINVLSSGFLNLEQQSILGVELMLATSLWNLLWCDVHIETLMGEGWDQVLALNDWYSDKSQSSVKVVHRSC